jgi:Uma2 family endonuclease
VAHDRTTEACGGHRLSQLATRSPHARPSALPVAALRGSADHGTHPDTSLPGCLRKAQGRRSIVAVTVATSLLTTADELLQMPDDGMRYELVRGELLVMTPAGARHGRLAVKVGGLLFEHERKTACGVAFGAETGFLISRDPDTVRAPDAAFVSRERFEAVGDTDKYWPGAPDFAAEVISPKDTFHEVQDKALEWLAAGTIIVLVLDPPKRTATVYRSGGDAHVYGDQDTLDLSDAVPGFTVPVARLFA